MQIQISRRCILLLIIISGFWSTAGPYQSKRDSEKSFFPYYKYLIFVKVLLLKPIYHITNIFIEVCCIKCKNLFRVHCVLLELQNYQDATFQYLTSARMEVQRSRSAIHTSTAKGLWLNQHCIICGDQTLAEG